MNIRPPVVAIDIGGTKIAGGIVTPGGEVYVTRQVPTAAQTGAAAVLARAIGLARELRDAWRRQDGPDPAAVGIGTAGDVDPATGAIIYATDALPGWQGTQLRARLVAALGLPVFVDNDGNMMALGEAVYGAGRGCRHLVGLTVGTGIGGGVIVDGRIYHGAAGQAGGAGHIIVEAQGRRRCACGGRGCLEAYAPAPAIVADYLRKASRRQASGLDPARLSVKEIAELAERGDEAAQATIRRAAAYLGAGIATLLNLLNPSLVVVGGGVAQIGEPYLAAVREAAARHALPPVRRTPIVPALLGTQANLVGAAEYAWQHLAGPDAIAY